MQKDPGFLTWIIDSFEFKKDLASYEGSSSPEEHSPADHLDHVDTLDNRSLMTWSRVLHGWLILSFVSEMVWIWSQTDYFHSWNTTLPLW